MVARMYEQDGMSGADLDFWAAKALDLENKIEGKCLGQPARTTVLPALIGVLKKVCAQQAISPEELISMIKIAPGNR